MALKVVKRNKVLVPVKGKLPDEEGKLVPFDFTLHCIRLPQEEITAALKDKDETVVAFVKRITTGWEQVFDEHGDPIPFSTAALADVLSEAGLASVCSQAYLANVGAVAKN